MSALDTSYGLRGNGYDRGAGEWGGAVGPAWVGRSILELHVPYPQWTHRVIAVATRFEVVIRYAGEAAGLHWSLARVEPYTFPDERKLAL